MMTAVFVHGVPETGRLWDPLRRHLKAESLALNLPGFSTPRPAGFGATMDDYVRWLSGELSGISGPVDLVGHDWGALLVARVAMLDFLPLRSWAMDVASILHPDYVWHDLAQLWQTSGAGEQWAQTMRGNTTAATAALTAAGVPAEDASVMGAQFDATMAGCILDLYRSAMPNPYAHWGGDLIRTAAPGLVVQPLSDPYDDQINSQKVAERLGAHVECLPGQSHWWMLSAPEEGAAALLRFWKSVGRDS
ncbi:alpha/beta fold hydrolase [Streptomyces chartreusis]|uniref:alpha/beta fold hydrolase n=2 Tax=Streptomyces chartreusis TaxID=1969 RepID=UPI0035E11BE1